MPTIDEKLKSAGGFGPGFEFVRLVLAFGVMALHAFTVTNQYYPADDTPIWLFHYALVPMFFALSGFLVTASAMRLPLRAFLVNRGLRVLPALAVVTTACALVIGPIFTTLPTGDYFASPIFASYFLNLFGCVHFDLPGVFETHPFTRVNGSLWSVPFELGCYAFIGLLICLTIRRRLALVLAAGLYLLAAVLLHGFDLLRFVQHPGVRKVFSAFFLEYEAAAMSAFLVGSLGSLFRDRIPYDGRIFLACVLLVTIIAFALPQKIGELAILRPILTPTLAYIVVYSGLTQLPLPRFFRAGDYSYGVYLCHQPVLQIVVALAPAAALAPRYGAVFCLCAALPVVLAVAWLSWRYIESPALALRRRFAPAANSIPSAEPSRLALGSSPNFEAS